MARLRLKVEGAYTVAGCNILPAALDRAQHILEIQVCRPPRDVPSQHFDGGQGIALHVRTEGVRSGDLDWFGSLTAAELEQHGGDQVRCILLIAQKLSAAYNALEAQVGPQTAADEDDVGPEPAD